VGKSLAEVKFRENYGVSVIVIRRDGRQLPTPSGKEILQVGDTLIVAGKAELVKILAGNAPL
jgi:K+/H+ antiporter YhaU regulatory subunit KhtT